MNQVLLVLLEVKGPFLFFAIFYGVITVFKGLPSVWDPGELIRNNEDRKIFKA